jgi:hypothetical protein
VEQARAFRSLMDARGWSQRQIAEHLHVSQSSVCRALALLELPAPLQSEVDAGLIPASTAASLARAASPEERESGAALARAGMVTRDQVRARVGRGAAPRRFEIPLPGGVVVAVTHPDPLAGPPQVESALLAAAALVRQKAAFDAA